MAIADRNITNTFINTTTKDDIPFDLLGIFGAGKDCERLTTFWTTTIVLPQFMKHFNAGQI
jgi:hypothetical protein